MPRRHRRRGLAPARLAAASRRWRAGSPRRPVALGSRGGGPGGGVGWGRRGGAGAERAGAEGGMQGGQHGNPLLVAIFADVFYNVRVGLTDDENLTNRRSTLMN